MTTCWSCGRDTAPDRACPHCGQAPASDWRTDTAEQPPVAADDRAVVPETTYRHRGRGHLAPWMAGVAAMALGVVGAAGLWLLTADRNDRALDSSVSGPAPDSDATPSATGTPTTGGEPDQASPSPTEEDSDGPDPSPSGTPVDLARLATAVVPATAPPNQDLSGNMVRYEARNMLDGVPETCWRMAGDAAGEEIVFRLDEPTALTSVGLINGYAKSATDGRGRALDWYHGNRRVLRVQWVFDDGTTVDQTLGDTSTMQRLRIRSVTTETVRLRLVTVSPPGTGPAARNYTPISDVALIGHAAARS